MINWFFVWSSKRPPIWESTLMNMNQSLSNTDYIPFNGELWYAPVTYKDLPPKFVTPNHKKVLNGQILEQFENEAFKYVIEENESEHNPKDKIIIKRHLTPQLGLNEYNSKTLNLDKIYKFFDNYQWVSLGLFFAAGTTREIPGGADPSALPHTILYGRNHNNKIVNLETGLPMEDYTHLTCATYINFKLLKDKNYVMCTLNPHLVAVPHGDDFIIDNKHRFLTLDTFDATIGDYIIKPLIEGATLVNGHLFAKSGERFTIDIGKSSLMSMKYGEIPEFPVKIETNITYSKSGNKLSFIVDKDIGYVKLHIDVGSLSDKYNNKDTAGVTTLEYIVIGEENGS